MALSEKYIIENPENYTTSTYFYSNLYGIDASNNVDKCDPWEMGIECLLGSDGRDCKIRENSKFSIMSEYKVLYVFNFCTVKLIFQTSPASIYIFSYSLFV